MQRFLKLMNALKMLNMLNGMDWRGWMRKTDDDAGDAEPDESDEADGCPRAHASADLMIRTHYSRRGQKLTWAGLEKVIDFC